MAHGLIPKRVAELLIAITTMLAGLIAAVIVLGAIAALYVKFEQWYIKRKSRDQADR
jgi:hypothetical protein